VTELFEQALGEFNAHMGTAYTSEAIELVPITRRNGVRKKNAVIERLHARNKPVSSPSAFSYMFGEAIIGMDGDRVSGKAAILFRTELPALTTAVYTAARITRTRALPSVSPIPAALSRPIT
jgi:hypothetical protein